VSAPLYLLQTLRETATPLCGSPKRKITPCYTHTHSISCAAFFSAQIKSQHQDSFKTQWRDTDICDACLLASSVATIGVRIDLLRLYHYLIHSREWYGYRERERELLGIFDIVPHTASSCNRAGIPDTRQKDCTRHVVLHPRLAPVVRAAGLKREGSNDQRNGYHQSKVVGKAWRGLACCSSCCGCM
jgi:hypothetical protein